MTQLKIGPGQEIANRALGEQVRTRLGEAYKSTAFMHHEPALFDRAIEPGLVLRGRAPQFTQEWPVDLLDQDAAVEVGLDRVGELDDFAGGDVRIS
jgi:hypothetical protein